MISFRHKDDSDLFSSQLFNEQSFFPAFITDVRRATKTIIIESPFITYRRLSQLLPVLEKAVLRGVKVIVNTRDPQEHNELVLAQAENGVTALQHVGATVLYTVNHHRKIAMIDGKILYEGSLNILSQADSCEVMRRIESVELVKRMVKFIGLCDFYLG